MNATDPTLANILQVQGNLEHYHVPKYQREYTWGRNEWEQLLNDIEENDIGYFMGSIICIDDNSELGPGESRIFEVVDGQQRLTTLSIIFMSIYCRLLEIEESLTDEDEEEKDDYRLILSNIRKQLVHKKAGINKAETGYFQDKSNKTKYFFLRVQPSTQNSNFNDYLHILNELELIKGDYKSKFCGVRRLYKAYNYFYDNLPDTYDGIKEILHKINSLKFIHISVTSSSDAFVLFESLNNRGVPLSAMDIIKNKMLAHLEKQHNMDIDDAYDEWQRLLTFLPEYKDQERFLRQYYNTFKIYPEIKLENFTRATKSSLIKIYEQFIKKNAKDTINGLLEKAEIYNSFIEPGTNSLTDVRRKYLLDLDRIGSAPSYLFLLYLCSLPSEKIDNKEAVIDDILQFFIKYYVRRNITDFPNTRDLDTINMDVIEKCDKYLNGDNKLNSQFIVGSFMNGKEKPSKIGDLKEGFEDNLFYYNSGMARFVLSKLDEISHSREYKPDLWARNEKGLLVWTVEHIFPQGENIPECWVNMIANGDKKKAEEIHEELVHCLGNLTLSGYNSKLSNASFEDKQNLHENKKFLGHKINIGYKNGLSLNNFLFSVNDNNTNLAEIDKWTKTSIKKRNNAIVDVLLKIFAFNKEELNDLEKEENT
ncbi:MAG: hypothetical protein MAG551_00408 [Candidatus Scalindua arabica]|uniref:DUF262 domain-containing protein n=1 Tax=Candidatus Scalindua arabica TaxID=1127984 RepID=A0A941W2H5_9BACT|nr:hypothetical protein [Candidatus Scalindua arabica]